MLNTDLTQNSPQSVEIIGDVALAEKLAEFCFKGIDAELNPLGIRVNVTQKEDGTYHKTLIYPGSWFQFKYARVGKNYIKSNLVVVDPKTGQQYYINSIALVLGLGYYALDFDFDAQRIYHAWLTKQLERDPDFLSKVYIERTRKGWHVIFYCPMLQLTKDDRKLAMRPNENGKPITLGECRITGDCVIIAPSEGYTVESGNLLTLKENAVALEDAKAMIADMRAFNELPPKEPKAVKKARRALFVKQETKAFDGDKGCDVSTPWGAADAAASIEDMVNLLEEAGWNYATTDAEGRIGYRYPEKTDGSISVSILPPTEDTPTLIHVFTTSTAFDADKSYSYSAAYAILKCDGDFAESARELYAQGYGERHEPTAYQAPVIKVSAVNAAKATTHVARLMADKNKKAVLTDVLPQKTEYAAKFLTQLWLSIPTLEDRVAVLAPFLLGFGIVTREDAIKLLRTLFVDDISQTDEELEQSLIMFDNPEDSPFPISYLLTHELRNGIWFRLQKNTVPADWSSFGVIGDEDPIIKTIMRDDFTECPMWVEPISLFEGRTGEIKDADISRVARYINDKYRLRYGLQEIVSGINSATVHSSRRFHQIQKKLNSLPAWDHVARCAMFPQKYLGATEEPLNSLMFERWMNSAISVAFEPGKTAPVMLVFCGRQGIGKSLSCNALSFGYFSDSVSATELQNDEQLYERTQGAWIVEISELAGFRKASQAQLKRVISSMGAIYRNKYAAKPEYHPRKFVLVGTTNERQFLLDVTGNRRYWIIECEQKFNTCPLWHELTPQLIEQVWAERLYKYRQGDNSLELPEDVQEQLAERQYNLVEAPPLAAKIAKIVGEAHHIVGDTYFDGATVTNVPTWVNYPVRVDLDQLHSRVYSHDKVPDRMSKLALTEALTYLGWENRSKYDAKLGRSVRGWYRPESDKTEQVVICQLQNRWDEPKWYAAKYIL